MSEARPRDRDGEASVPARIKLPPGPRAPSLAQAVRYSFDQPGFFGECRSRYGRTWTMRLPGFPPAVVTSDRDAVRRLFTGDPLTRRHGNDLLRPLFGDRSLLLLEPPDHLARRRLELPPFHGDAVRAYGDRIRELTRLEVESWEPGAVVATQPRARALTLQIALELVLGVRDAGLRTELARIFDSFDNRVNNFVQFLPPVIARRAPWNVVSRRFYERIDHLHALLGGHVARSRRDPALADRTDVLAYLLRARDEDGAGLSDADLRDELLTLVIAGHETTATAVGWACDLLAHNPAVAERLRESVARGERDYLKATVKEALRARAVAYVSAARHPLEPFPIGDWLVGPEATVLVDAQGIHSDPEVYPEPETFRPERFLGDQPDGYAWVPFGGGAHRCLGAALALLELEIVLETLATRLRLTPAGPPAQPVRRGVTLTPDSAGRVRVVAVPAPPRRRAAASLG